MKTHLDKKQDISQRTSDTQLQRNNSQPTFQFVDNRPEAIAQRQLQEGMKNSPQNQEQQAIQKMADNHAAQQFTIQKKENNTGLPDNLKSGIENLSGYSMDDVKVHYNSEKPAQLQARAYAQGTDIHLGVGQEKHLPHEAWHVVQQKQGRVKPTIQMKGGVNVNDDKGLEKEADVMGGKALQVNNINTSIIQPVIIDSNNSIVQRFEIEDKTPNELKMRFGETVSYMSSFTEFFFEFRGNKLPSKPKELNTTFIPNRELAKEIILYNENLFNQDFANFKSLLIELDGVRAINKKSSAKKKANKKRGRIRVKMQKSFDILISKVFDFLSKTANAIEKAAWKVREYRKLKDIRKGIAKYEEEGTWIIADPFYETNKYITKQSFRTTVRQRHGGILKSNNENNENKELTQDDIDAFNSEKQKINIQLNIWKNTQRTDLTGLNQDGTWGTSAEGVGSNYKVTSISQAVWHKISDWWTKKGGWVSISDSADRSLKMDQVEGGLSPRINYHLNIN